ncbi:hypothetical protein E8P82_07850 [Arthrobacter echini]|uniref:TNase-like domain-containing protein n=1 Tax=Arthrobacter echini TaxID=1529066 RepID=A0A4V3Z5J0_9MICC|nr:thermonuclease family protein [Arthrobacter echini]THJ66829.1 hypothetical protein E8P82_07850 [Arthrobacter echini]
MNLLRSRRIAPVTLLTATIVASTLTACTSSTPSGETATGYEPGTVVRVIDGDTLVITFDGSDQTVRLLNVDTPETKHPDKPVECLGAEATEKLESMTPPGTKVALDFDVERTDRYDRVLAAVFIEDQTLVNAELARVGLGVPILIEPNSKYYDEVQTAYNEAESEGIGLLDPAQGCTLPAEVADAAEALTTATEAPVGETAPAAAATAAGIVAALTTATAAREAIDAGEDTVRVLALGATRAATMARGLDTQIADAEKKLTTVTTTVTALEKAEEDRLAAEAEAARVAEAERVEEERVRAEAAEAARVETERLQAEADARAEADRLAAEAAAAEQERIRNLPAVPAPAPIPAPAPAPAPYVPPAQPSVAPAPPAAEDPYPGYTGPRCYAPGGKTYRPC